MKGVQRGACKAKAYSPLPPRPHSAVRSTAAAQGRRPRLGTRDTALNYVAPHSLFLGSWGVGDASVSSYTVSWPTCTTHCTASSSTCLSWGHLLARLLGTVTLKNRPIKSAIAGSVLTWLLCLDATSKSSQAFMSIVFAKAIKYN